MLRATLICFVFLFSTGGNGSAWAICKSDLKKIQQSLRLRSVEVSDFSFFYAERGRLHSPSEFRWTSETSGQEAQAEFEARVKSAKDKELQVILVDGKPIGEIHAFVSQDLAITSTFIFAEHRGHGFGFAARQIMIDYLFQNTSIDSIEADVDQRNFASRRLCEKLGFKSVGLDEYDFTYRLNRSEWLRLRSKNH